MAVNEAPRVEDPHVGAELQPEVFGQRGGVGGFLLAVAQRGGHDDPHHQGRIPIHGRSDRRQQRPDPGLPGPNVLLLDVDRGSRRSQKTGNDVQVVVRRQHRRHPNRAGRIEAFALEEPDGRL